MTWGQALTGLTVLTVVGGGITYVIVWLRSRAPWATSRRATTAARTGVQGGTADRHRGGHQPAGAARRVAGMRQRPALTPPTYNAAKNYGRSFPAHLIYSLNLGPLCPIKSSRGFSRAVLLACR